MSEDYKRFFDIYENISWKKSKQELTEFGCMIPNCQQDSWEVTGRNDYDNSMWGVLNTTSLVLIFQRGKCLSIVKEVLTYSGANFIADFGGYLGLLLGASLLSIYDSALSIFDRIFLNILKYCKKYNCKF